MQVRTFEIVQETKFKETRDQGTLRRDRHTMSSRRSVDGSAGKEMIPDTEATFGSQRQIRQGRLPRRPINGMREQTIGPESWIRFRRNEMSCGHSCVTRRRTEDGM